MTHRNKAGKPLFNPLGKLPVMPKQSRYLDPASSTRQGLSSFDRAVLDVVDQIPRGRVMTYGSIAEWIGQGSPRLVARVMSTKSDPDTPWQRVLRSDGSCAKEVAQRQLALLREEGTPFRPVGGQPGTRSDRVDLAAAHWDPGSAGTSAGTSVKTNAKTNAKTSARATRSPAQSR